MVELIHALFRASPYASCQPTFLSSLLPLYHGTLAVADKQILSLFQLFEAQRKLSTVSLFKAWSANGVVGDQRALDVLLSLDAGRVFATCIAFPLRRTLRSDGEEKVEDEQQGLYDPAFVLPLIVSVLNERLTGLDWVEVLRSNVLGLVVCSLASRDAPMRAIGKRVLAKTVGLISVR